MEHEKEKRKASPNALDADHTPDPKIQVIDEDEYEGEYEDEDEGESTDDDAPMVVWGFTTKPPHISLKRTIIECFFKEKYSEVLAQKVINLTQLKTKIDHLLDSLRRALVDGDELGDFDSKVNDLFDSSYFTQACAETYYEEDCSALLYDIDVYKSEAQAQVRIERLLKDGFLTCVLEEKDYFSITRGVLSVLLAFWSDDALSKKVRSGIGDIYRTEKTARSFKNEKVDGINVPASVEGLKEAVASSFPADEANMMCEQIERKKEHKEI